MKLKTTSHPVLLFLAPLPLLFTSSCVSRQIYYNQQEAHERQALEWKARQDSSAQVIYRLEIELAERRGENTALLATQDKLQDRIAALRDQTEQLKQESASTVGNLDERLKEKNAAITARQAKIDGLKATLEQRNAAMNQLALDLRDTLRQVAADAFDIEVLNGYVTLSFKSDFLFAAGVTNRLSTAGQQALGVAAHVLSLYPALDVQVIGHTDNSPLRRTSIQDKWEFSALRAVTVVQTMTKRFEFSPSRILAVGKGDFSPRASNATPEGRARNERIELRAYPSEERLLRDLKRVLE